jgi:hypothetical protein
MAPRSMPPPLAALTGAWGVHGGHWPRSQQKHSHGVIESTCIRAPPTGERCGMPSCSHFLSLPTWLPITPPTAAPPTVPPVLPPVSTEPATAPTPAPIAVSFSRVDIPLQAIKLSSNVAAPALTANLCIVFITAPLSQTLVKKLTFGRLTFVTGRCALGCP